MLGAGAHGFGTAEEILYFKVTSAAASLQSGLIYATHSALASRKLTNYEIKIKSIIIIE